MEKVPDFRPGDKVKFRADATTNGGREPIGPVFMELTWEVVQQDGNRIELKSKLEKSNLTILTFAHKLYRLEHN